MELLQAFVSFLLFVSATLAIDIPATPTWPSGRCTDKSLTIPSWIISDYKVVSGTATFRIINRVDHTPSRPFVTCTPGKKECQSSASGNEMRMTWEKGTDGNNVIGISEFWICADEGDTTIFTGTGSTTITSCSGNDCVSPITYLAQGGLSLPVPLTPTQPKPPAGYNAPACANVGKSQWTVSGVEYKNYTKGQCKQWYFPDRICIDPESPDGSFISKGQYLKLNVTNKAISHEVLCKFTPDYDKYTIPSPLRCTGGNFNEITLDVTFSGTAPNFNVKVEELWYCLENPLTNVNPSVIVASGSVALPLTCESRTGVTGTADDIITICSDPASSHAVDGAQLDKKSLPPYSLVTAYPVHGGCTFDSVVNPTFYFRGMFFETNPYPVNDPNSATLARFTSGLTGPGFADFFYYQNKAISGTGVNTVYTCAVYYDGKPKDQHWNCTYAFNPHTKVLTQDKVWECRDKNPSQPLYFDGTGTFDWSIYPYYRCDNPGGNVLSCYWHGDHAQLQPGVPFDIPKVTASLVNVLPPDYGQRIVATHSSDTVRVNGKWQKVNEGT